MAEFSHDTVVDEMIQRGHQSVIEQGIDHLPIGRIPADQENFLGKGFRHKTTHSGGGSRKGQQSTMFLAKSRRISASNGPNARHIFTFKFG